MELKEQQLLQNGTITSREFSFEPAKLEHNLKANLGFHTYDKADPATWPLITLDVIDAHCHSEYTGAQLLPPYVAYSASVIERLFRKHTKKELTQDATAGSLQSRYPCNFGRRDIRKMFVGMTPAEITEFKQGLAMKARAEAAAGPPKDEEKPSFASHVPDRSVPCQRPDCIQERLEVIKLLGILNEQQMERQNLQVEVPELIGRDKEITARRAEVQQDEKEYQEALELRDKLIAELEKYVAKLQDENSKLKGGYRPPTVEDYVSQDEGLTGEGLTEEERPTKRARVD
jgi:hypothetical protein